nr:hypothetical protein [Tanacetum cinerariifolium]
VVVIVAVVVVGVVVIVICRSASIVPGQMANPFAIITPRPDQCSASYSAIAGSDCFQKYPQTSICSPQYLNLSSHSCTILLGGHPPPLSISEPSLHSVYKTTIDTTDLAVSQQQP